MNPALSVQRVAAVLDNGSLVRRAAIALIAVPAIGRRALVGERHLPVTLHLGDDGCRGDDSAVAVGFRAHPHRLRFGIKVVQPVVRAAGNPAIPVGLPEGTLFHPTFLYEILWNVLGIIVILALEKKFELRWGRVFALYLIWYGIGRSFLESIRIDPSEMFLGVRTNIWAAWLAIIVGVVLFWLQYRRHPGRETSVYAPGRQWQPAPAVD